MNIVAQTATFAASGFPAPNSFETRMLQNLPIFVNHALFIHVH